MEIGLLQRKLDYIRDLVRLSKNEHHKEKNFYDFVLRALIFLSRATIVQFWKLENDNKMTLVSSLGTDQILPINTKKLYNGIANEKCILKGKPLRIINPTHRKEFEQFHAIRTHHEIYSVLLLPIYSK
jgi:hypothetical protein